MNAEEIERNGVLAHPSGRRGCEGELGRAGMGACCGKRGSGRGLQMNESAMAAMGAQGGGVPASPGAASSVEEPTDMTQLPTLIETGDACTAPASNRHGVSAKVALPVTVPVPDPKSRPALSLVRSRKDGKTGRNSHSLSIADDRTGATKTKSSEPMGKLDVTQVASSRPILRPASIRPKLQPKVFNPRPKETFILDNGPDEEEFLMDKY